MKTPPPTPDVDWPGLARRLEAKVKRNPQDLLSVYELAAVYYHAGRFRRMVPLLQALLRREPGLSLAHFLLSLAYARLGDDRSVQAADAAAQCMLDGLRAPDLPLRSAPPAQAGPVKAEAANPHLAEIDFYQRSLDQDRFNTEQSLLLGMAYKRLGWQYAALEIFKQVARLNPSSDEACFEMGLTYQQLGRLREAAEAFRRAVSLKPEAAQARLQLGLVHLALREKTQAREQYRALQELDPDLAKQLAVKLR